MIHDNGIDPEAKEVPFYVVGTHADQPELEEVEMRQVNDYAKMLGTKPHFVSSKENTGIQTLFEKIAEDQIKKG